MKCVSPVVKGTLLVGLILACSPFGGEKPVHAQKQTTGNVESDVWQVIYFGKQRIGYAHSTSAKVKQSNGQTLRETSTLSVSTFQRFGQKITIKTRLSTTETLEGQLLSFSYSQHAPPTAEKKTTGRVRDGKLSLENTIAGRTTQQVMDWSADIKPPNYQDQLLKEQKNLKPGQTLTLKTFLPDFNKITTITLTGGQADSATLLNGKTQKLQTVEMSQSAIPGVTTALFLNERGESVKTETKMLGTTMTTYQVSKETALKEIAGAEMDLAVSTLVKVKQIPNAHKPQKITYRITLPNADPSKLLISDKTQQIKKIGDHQAELTVISRPLPKSATPGEVKPEFLASTRFLQCEDANVKAHAESAANRETDAAKVAVNMERYVNKVLTKKNFSTALASAGEVATSLEGDCTEHAVLLAAMLRAKKIPSRVVAGLVYITRLSSFGGHMWTEVNLGGEWIPLDATIGQGGIGAAHIKLSESSFGEDAPTPASLFLPLMQIIGNLEIEIVAIENL